MNSILQIWENIWIVISIALAIWFLLPLWIYAVTKLISIAWFKGQIEAQKDFLKEIANGKKN